MEELFLGKIFLKIDIVGDSIRFVRNDGYIFIMKHEQDCCESVYIEDINGDLNDLIGSPMLIADEMMIKRKVLMKLKKNTLMNHLLGLFIDLLP